LRTRQWTGIVVIIGILTAVGAWLLWRGYLPLPTTGDARSNGAPPRQQAVSVVVAKAYTATVRETTDAVGSLQAAEAVTLTSDVSGIVQAIHFQETEPVEQGAVLLELDAEEVRAQLAEALARRDDARRRLERVQALPANSAISQAEVDEAKAAYEIAVAQVQAARSRLADRRIIAPFDGVIGLRQISPGALVEPGTAVATLLTLDPIELRFAVPAGLLPRIQPDSQVFARLDGFPDAFEGQVRRIAPSVDVSTRSVALEAEVPNPDARLLPGMFATVELVLETRQDAVLIPEEALLLEGVESYVFAVSDGMAQRTVVQTGVRRDAEVEIRAGLAPGTCVVIEGLQKIRAGQPVTVRDIRPAANGALSSDAEC